MQWPTTALASLRRQLGREWRAGPIHRLTIAGPKPHGLAIRPRDHRPPDPSHGAMIVGGVFTHGGETLEAGPRGDPWRRPAPSKRFAAHLHGFGWAPDLIATGEDGAREALRLWLEWRRVFGRYNTFAWSGAALERRVFNLACATPALIPLASEAEAAALTDGLARQARHLLADDDDPGRAVERACVAALAGAALAGPAGDRLLARSLARLAKAAPEAVLRDGVHASRSPERGLELLFDLLALDDALSQRGAPAPLDVARSIDRIGAATRFFALPTARLAAFNGGETCAPPRVAAALALDAASSDPGKSAPYGRFHRLQGAGLELIVDVGVAARGPWAESACAQTGAIEVVCDGRWRLIAGSAASAKAPPGESVRGPRGGSCLALGESWPDPEEDVAVDRQESEDAVWLDLSHDGWRRELGLSCTRRLYLDLEAGELRGEDAMSPSGRARRGATSFEVRFHLAPGVAASIASDGKSALLRPAGGTGWRLRGDAEFRLEPGAIFEEGVPRAAEEVVMAGAVSLAKGARVRWKLSRDEARD
jgi:uncharacterized heparinase superfamily protein